MTNGFWSLARSIACLAAAAPWLGACAAVDRYGPRAVAYNMEANDSRSELILTNIVRAAYREPLQFSEVASVTGIASAGGTLGAAVPVIGTGSLLSPQVTASGGPNFSFSNLSTQEFYQASSAEIDNTTIALMLNQGFDPRAVFPLVISDITLTDRNRLRRVRMDVDTASQFFSSFTATTGLINQGLTAKAVDSGSRLGPALSPADARTAAFEILRGQDISKEPDLSRTKDGSYELKKSGKKVILCFDPSLFEQIDSENTSDSNTKSVKLDEMRTVTLALKNGRADPDFTIHLPDAYRCGLEKVAANTGERTGGKKSDSVQLVFRMRSLQGIYEYLGSIVRIELGLNGPATPLAIKGPEQDVYLFNLKRGAGAPGDITASTAFGEFSVAPDPSGYDLTSQAIKAIAFLQALNSKATTLPAPVTTSVLVR